MLSVYAVAAETAIAVAHKVRMELEYSAGAMSLVLRGPLAGGARTTSLKCPNAEQARVARRYT